MLQLCFLFCVDGQHIICAGMTNFEIAVLSERN